MEYIAYYSNAITAIAFMLIVVISTIACVKYRSASYGLIAIGLLIFLVMEIDSIFFGFCFTINGLTDGLIEERIAFFSREESSYLKMFGSILMLIGFWKLNPEIRKQKLSKKL